MYAPSHFRVNDETAALLLFNETGFASLTTIDEGCAVVSHIPMLADPARRILRGHLARANPHAALIAGRAHLAAAIGPNAYISPDWYSDAKQVPTWNYLAVHIEGEGRILGEPDAVDALLTLAHAPAAALTQSVYNITAFNPSADEIRGLVVEGFPDAEISFEPDLKRQAIIDSWPADVDDSAARRDWSFSPQFALERAFEEYLIPNIRDRYRN